MAAPCKARLLGLRVRVPPGHGYFSLVDVVCCAGRGLCDGLIPRPEESLNVIRCSSNPLHLQ